MKNIISWFLVLATFTGVFTGLDGICLKNHETQVVAADSLPAHSQKAPASDCHHEGSPCHSCHLGHCAFVVSTNSTALIAPIKEIVSPSYITALPTDYPSSLFRPPIA